MSSVQGSHVSPDPVFFCTKPNITSEKVLSPDWLKVVKNRMPNLQKINSVIIKRKELICISEDRQVIKIKIPKAYQSKVNEVFKNTLEPSVVYKRDLPYIKEQLKKTGDNALYLYSSGGGGHRSAKDALMDRRLMELLQKINPDNSLPHPQFATADAFLKWCKSKKLMPESDVLTEYICKDLGQWAAAQWDDAQKAGDVPKQEQLAANQGFSDFLFSWPVYESTLNDLCARAPSHIVCTQAMALPSILFAIAVYNALHKPDDKPDVKLHLYMTDMPTEYSIHFFNSLKGLLEGCGKQHLELYAPEAKPGTDWQALCGLPESQVHQLKTNELPVRPAFLSAVQAFQPCETPTVQLKVSCKNELDLLHTTLQAQGHSVEQLGDRHNASEQYLNYSMGKDDQGVFIMLGSQVTQSAVEAYVDKFLEVANSNSDKEYHVFVYTGRYDDKDPNCLYKQLCAYMQEKPRWPPNLHVVPLSFQDPAQLVSLDLECHTITRSGGATAMELLVLDEAQKALQLSPKHRFVHAQRVEGRAVLEDSIPLWEKGNYLVLQERLGAQVLEPSMLNAEMLEAEIIVGPKQELATPMTGMVGTSSGRAHITRFDDTSYQIISHGKTYIVKLEDANIIRGANPRLESFQQQEMFYRMVQQLAEKLDRHEELPGWKIAGQTWGISQHAKETPFLSHLISAWHQQGDDSVTYLTINGSLKGISSKQEPTKEQFNLVSAAKQEGIKIADMRSQRRQGVLEREGCDKIKVSDLLLSPVSSSPFTSLAAKAFQQYESSFSGPDQFRPEDCHCCLQLIGGQLQLVVQDSIRPTEESKQINMKTCARFRDQMILEYGQEKFNYICHLYGIDFNQLLYNGDPLTPEHVYRVNMGLHNIEIEDAQALLNATQPLRMALSAYGPNDLLISTLSQMDVYPMRISQLRGIINLIQNQSADGAPLTVADLTQWLDQFAVHYGKTITALDKGSLNALMSVLFAVDNEAAFTGRKIGPALKSGGYTLGGHKEAKPWIDQQELLQIFDKLQRSSDIYDYYEKLSHVVCKKHLFRKHPELGLKTGVIIPGPTDPTGTKHWYEVNEAFYNGYGKICYTLTPMGQDSTLPVIRLYRSTSSSPYAAFGVKSVRSDFNPLNLGGYEGKDRTDMYEQPLVDKHTIPLWVAYQLQAAKELQEADNSPNDLTRLKKIQFYLSNANSELLAEQRDNTRPRAFAEVIRKHGGILNTLYSMGKINEIDYGRICGKLETSNGVFERVFGPLQLPGILEENDRALAARLTEVLSRVTTTKPDPKYDEKFIRQLKLEIAEFINDLNDNVVSNRSEKLSRQKLRELEKNILNGVKAYEHAAGLDLDTLKTWSKALEIYAKETKEDLASKDAKDLSFVGHSLGGGQAQIFTCHHMTNRHRVPCPGRTCATIAFDAPGIDQQDNQRYINYLMGHGDLLRDLGIGFEIYHQHEAGDPVPSGGTHLGAAKSVMQAEQILEQKQLHFTGQVMTRLKDAKNKAIRETATVHATQFLEGTEGIDYETRSFNPLELGILEYRNSFSGIEGRAAAIKANKLEKNLWHYPFSTRTANALQKNKLTYKTLQSYLGEGWFEHDPRYAEHLDARGNMAVTSSGLAYGEKNG